MRTPSQVVQNPMCWRRPDAAGPFPPAAAPEAGSLHWLTGPTKRRPLRATVRITACSAPLSPTARRAALIRLVSVESDTALPPQTLSIRSSLLTT
jgi:hypothetical protein